MEDDSRSIESYIVLDHGRTATADSDNRNEEFNHIDSSCHTVFESRDTMNSVRLKGAVSAEELRQILIGIWKRTSTLQIASDEEVPFEKGEVTNLDPAEMLYIVEEVMKKLVTHIIDPSTTLVDKTAAIDVYTWIASRDTVVQNPTFSLKDSCNWIMQLLNREVVAVRLTALRGIRNLVENKLYSSLITQHDRFGDILNYMGSEANQGINGAVYISEIYMNLFREMSHPPGEDLFITKLLECMKTFYLPCAARKCGIECLRSYLDSAEDQTGFIQRLIDDKNIITWFKFCEDEVLTMTIDLMVNLMDHMSEEKIVNLLKDLTGDYSTTEALFAKVNCGIADLQTKILNLILKVVTYIPSVFYLDYLEANWIRFQIVLERRGEESDQIVLDILHKLSSIPGLETKSSEIRLPDKGQPFVQLIMENLDDRAIDILHFMWSHYQGMAEVFFEVELVRKLINSLNESNWLSNTAGVPKICEIVNGMAGSLGTRQSFEHCLVTFISTVTRSTGQAAPTPVVETNNLAEVEALIREKRELEEQLKEEVEDRHKTEATLFEKLQIANKDRMESEAQLRQELEKAAKAQQGLEEGSTSLQPAGRTSGPSSSTPVDSAEVIKLKSQIAKLRNTLGAKEVEVDDLSMINQNLMTEMRSRECAYDRLAVMNDEQRKRIGELESVLRAIGHL